MDERSHGTSRRGFLKFLASAGLVLSAAADPSRGSTQSWNIHRATRNTRMGAVGERLPRLRRAPRPFKPYEGRRRVALPTFESGPDRTLGDTVRGFTKGASFSREPLTLAELGRLLHLTNGITSNGNPDGATSGLRAAPSAGALYAGEVYVVADQIAGLAPGVYSYLVARHALVEVASQESGLEAVARAQALPSVFADAAAAVVLTNVFDRYTWGYANRGYRYALIDTGHIGENLRLATAAAGLAVESSLAFHDDAMNELLRIDGHDEAVCAVHAVGRRAEVLRGSGPRGRRALAERSSRGEPIEVDGTVPRRYHAATKLVSALDDALQSPLVGRARAAPAGGEALPPPRPDVGMTTGNAIRVRRSTRRFTEAAVPIADLSFVLEMAMGHRAPALFPGIDLYVAPHRVEGLAPGLLRYRSEAHRLERTLSKSLAEDLVRVCLRQKMAGEAAAALFMVGWLGPEGAHARTRVYRDLLIHAGAVGQRIYLSAEACGLTARNLAAFIDDDLNRLLGLDGTSEAVVHLTLLGTGD